MTDRLSLTEDLSLPALVLALVVLVVWLLVLLLELLRRRRAGYAVLVSGFLAFVALGLALFRPVRVKAKSNLVGPRVVVLVDVSRRLLLPDGSATRDARAEAAVRELGRAFSQARVQVLGFAESDPAPYAKTQAPTPRQDDSDLSRALGWLSRAPGERASAVVVMSDGRLTRPGPEASDLELQRLVSELGVPVHSVGLVREAPPDAAVRRVFTAGSAVAHQPLSLRVDIACSGGLNCQDLPVTVRELRQNAEPAVLAQGVARLEGKEVATLDLTVTLERAGARVVEVEIVAPSGDRVPENDRRILTFNVTRERVRLLHVAGRPTYDVRSLRMWLKSNESVDLVAFFILRLGNSTPLARDEDDSEELALIPFPVNELFTEHLPSFDAIMLQDIDAVGYDLAQYLPALERYVRSGGGLIMIGGPSAFAGGGYARSPLERALPTELPEVQNPFDLAEFVPSYTDAGRVAPVLRPLRDLVGEELPKMVGSNTLGRPREGSIVLWEHPARRAGEGPMPVLSLADAGDGRSIALAIDGTHQLGFSEFAQRTAGRAYGALWDGLLGWLMRDMRYEAARIQLLGSCIAGETTRARLTRLPGAEGDLELTIERLGVGPSANRVRHAQMPANGVVELELGTLEAGGYTARARIGKSPATRFDFACERGGAAWADTRPDLDRLTRLAKASGGRSVFRDAIDKLPLPAPIEVAVQREVVPLLPVWVWTSIAAVALGWHFIERRRAGMA